MLVAYVRQPRTVGDQHAESCNSRLLPWRCQSATWRG
jgi:hypothetical protein